MANPNHDERGRFSSGSNGAAATGDHQAVSPSTETRNVPGHGTVLRSKVIAKHAGVASLGTSSGGGGGGGSRFTEAASARVIRQKAIDQRHYGIPGDLASRMAAQPSTPKGSITATPGRFDARGMKLKNYGG
jgi:hypothetical protein